MKTSNQHKIATHGIDVDRHAALLRVIHAPCAYFQRGGGGIKNVKSAQYRQVFSPCKHVGVAPAAVCLRAHAVTSAVMVHRTQRLAQTHPDHSLHSS